MTPILQTLHLEINWIPLLTAWLVALAVSSYLCLFGTKFGVDKQTGVQKFHSRPTSRLGGRHSFRTSVRRMGHQQLLSRRRFVGRLVDRSFITCFFRGADRRLDPPCHPLVAFATCLHILRLCVFRISSWGHKDRYCVAGLFSSNSRHCVLTHHAGGCGIY